MAFSSGLGTWWATNQDSYCGYYGRWRVASLTLLGASDVAAQALEVEGAVPCAEGSAPAWRFVQDLSRTRGLGLPSVGCARSQQGRACGVLPAAATCSLTQGLSLLATRLPAWVCTGVRPRGQQRGKNRLWSPAHVALNLAPPLLDGGGTFRLFPAQNLCSPLSNGDSPSNLVGTA